jgi:hypothetical protein
MRNTKQNKYELFLNSVQKKEDEVVLASKEKLLKQIAAIVLAMPDRVVNHPNWCGKSLPRLRGNYTFLRDKCPSAKSTIDMVNDIVSHLNGWFQQRAGLIIVQIKYVNESFKHDPKANRIASIDVVMGYKSFYGHCCKCMSPAKHSSYEQKYNEVICESCAVAHAAH